MSSSVGMKKRKLDEISNTKPVEAKQIKNKLQASKDAVTQPSTTAKKNQRSSQNEDEHDRVSGGKKSRSTSRVAKVSDSSMTMIDTTTTVKKNPKDRNSAIDKTKKNRASSKRDPVMMDDDEGEYKNNKTDATTNKKGHKKVLTESSRQEILDDDINDDETLLTQSQVIIGNMFSLYALADKQPTKIKPVLDQIFSHDDNSEEFVVKTMFLYFMELMGVSDVTTLQYNAQYIARNSEEKKLLELFNNQEDKLEVSFDKLIFFSQEKKALEQKKLLKKVCKIFIANVVDLLPDKASYLSSVIQRVCVYSKAQHRLTRYSFTYVGLYLFKFLLGQQSELLKLKKNYSDKHKHELNLKQTAEAKQTQKRVTSIENAIDIINTNVQTIQRHIIMKRHQDATAMVRKSVYEFLLQLDDKELQIAFGSTNNNSDLYKMIFNAISDEDNQIRKIALNMVYAIITKVDIDDNAEDLITQNLERYKLDIFKLAIPTDKHQDTVIMVKSIQVIYKMIKMNPDIYTNDHKQMISNLVHYKNQSVREEIGEFLLTISDEFDDDAKLIELQKINPTKGVPEGFVLNFNEQPGKSRKQLLKLIKIFEKHVQTRSQYLTQHKRDDDNEDINIPNMGSQEVQKILACDCEERAILLFQTFMKKTSILYDIQSIVALLKRDDIEEDTKVVLSNLINTSLNFTLNMKNMKECNNLVYQKLWENSTAYLKLTVMNELLQTFRVQPRILEPLLRSLLTLSKTIEKDNQAEINDELGKDYAHLLLRIIEQTDIDEKYPETLQIIKASILSLSQLQVYFPLIRKEIQDLGLNYCEQLQQEIVPKLFSQKSHDDNQILIEVFSFLQKLNVLMTQLSIKQISDSEHLKSLASFAIINLGQMIIDNYHIISKLSKTQFSCLLQVPFSFIDQLFLDNQTNKEHIEFQRKIMQTLMNLYLDLHKQFKSDEARQVIVLRFLIESLIMAGGENRINGGKMQLNQSFSGGVVMGITDFPRVKDLIIDTIQNVSGRMKGNETVVNEQFQILYNLFTRDFQSLLSEIGVEFLINFGTSKDQMVASSIRKLYYAYKQRDSLYDQKKSIFYQFVLKIIYTIYQSTDTKIYKLQEQAPGDIEKERKQLGLDDLKIPITLQTYQKLVFIQQFLKTFQNSIMLLVINQKSQNPNTTSHNAHQNGLNKQQDEFAYFKLIEGIIRLSLQDKPNNLPLLLSIKYLMHKNFLQLKQQEGTLKGLRNYIDSNKEALKITHDEMEMIECIVSLIEDKIKQKKNPGSKTKKVSNIVANETIQQVGQDSKQKNDATMNLSLTNHNIEQHNTPGKPDNDETEGDDQISQQQLIKENKSISDTMNMIGQKRKTANRNTSRSSSRKPNISKSRQKNSKTYDNDSEEDMNIQMKSSQAKARQSQNSNIGQKDGKENLEIKRDSRSNNKKMENVKSPATNVKARQTSSNPRKQKKVK